MLYVVVKKFNGAIVARTSTSQTYDSNIFEEFEVPDPAVLVGNNYYDYDIKTWGYNPNLAELIEKGVERRIDHGWKVIRTFRVWAISQGMGAADSIATLSALSGIMSCLTLGLLDSALLLVASVELPLMDLEVQPGITVRDYFTALINEGK